LGYQQPILDMIASLAVLSSLTVKLNNSATALAAAVKANQSNKLFSPQQRTTIMANPILDALTAQVAASVTVEQSALDCINGIAARVQAAVDAAITGGATASDLAPVQLEVTALQQSAAALSAAIPANTLPTVPPA